MSATYTHGHSPSVLRSHSWRTATNSAPHLLPYLKASSTILDVGCGPGTITIDLAMHVPEGRVSGMDISSEVIEKAHANATAQGIRNVSFTTGDTHALPFADESFDVAHAHQVVQHVADPVHALREMRRVVKPGGIVACAESDFSGFLWYPEMPKLKEWQELYLKVARANGGEPDAGRRLHVWLKEAGFEKDKMEVSGGSWCYTGKEQTKWWGEFWAQRLVESGFYQGSVGRGWISEEELKELSETWRDWYKHDDAWFFIPHGRVIARKGPESVGPVTPHGHVPDTMNMDPPSNVTENHLNTLTVAQLKAICKEKKIVGYSKLNKPGIIQKILGASNQDSSSKPHGHGSANIPSSSINPPLATPAPASASSVVDSTCIASNASGSVLLALSADSDIQVAHTSTVPKEQPKKTKKPAAKKPKPKPNTSLKENASLSSAKLPEIIAPTTACLPQSDPSAPPKNASDSFPLSSHLESVTLSSSSHSSAAPSSRPPKRPLSETKAPKPSAVNPAPSVLSSKRPRNEDDVAATLESPSKKRKLPPISIQPNILPAFSIQVLNAGTLPASANLLPANLNAQFTPTSLIPIRNLSGPKHSTTSGKRFTPLVIKKGVAPTRTVVAVSKPSLAPPALAHLDFSATSIPVFKAITLPPSLANRKHVSRYALFLSAVPPEDLSRCALVSKMFRYSSYLSSSFRLSHDFSGRRLAKIRDYIPMDRTDMWPYLRIRQLEVTTRKERFYASFLGRLFVMKKRRDVIADRLWCSPDHDKQVTIAIRFLLTRLFFAFSIGDSKDGQGWKEGTVVDAQEVVKDEIWRVTVKNSRSEEDFHVVESTCEVLGSRDLRPDWAGYVARRTTETTSGERLTDRLSWTNHEEYEKGISKIWLRRANGEAETGAAKRVVAERYVMACVVGNSVSGRWMSSTEMEQDFSGLGTGQGMAVALKMQKNVNLFLPAHHHVESVHFTTSGGHALHPAIAVVRTPQREYFVLKDNGMQVGTEEDGIAEVWMEVIGCTSLGEAKVVV